MAESTSVAEAIQLPVEALQGTKNSSKGDSRGIEIILALSELRAHT